MITGKFQAATVLPSLLAIPTGDDNEYDDGDDDVDGDNPNVDDNVTNMQTKYHISQRPK